MRGTRTVVVAVVSYHLGSGSGKKLNFSEESCITGLFAPAGLEYLGSVTPSVASRFVAGRHVL